MIIFSVLAQTIYGSLQGMGKLFVPGTCLAIGAVVKYVLNVILVPKYGEVIPAITTVIYNAIACTLTFIILFKTLKEKPDFMDLFIKPLLATVAMAITTVVADKLLVLVGISYNIATIISIIIAVFAYVVFMRVFKTLTKDEVKQLPMGNKLSKILVK